jgi:uncharacterized protein (DUF1786 family)
MPAEPRSPVTIDVLYFEGCPHAASTLALVRSCATRFGADVAIVEHEGDYPSPSVLVNGHDIMGDLGATGRACRRDLPSEERIMDTIRAAREVPA